MASKKELKEEGVYVRMTVKEKRELVRIAESEERTPADAMRVMLRRRLRDDGVLS
jgi:hypothetical protein